MKLKKILSIALAQVAACGAVFAATDEAAELTTSVSVKTDAYVLETVAPKYPSEMLQRGKQGQTLLMLRVDASGEVSDVKVLASSNQLFSEAAIKSVKNWYFQPGTVDGVAIPQTVTVPVSFEIEGMESPSIASL
ncbi:energy transducer TonB [Pelagicoccus sp. NFK12]|uniref:Energy transducer TonB n=1 Tax=Pelagicoccus enzymogenes TaxID=2773457 RepID=A0A927FC60_9BACT|nr:energy transducer TonB [Pelagicoccus enzymogenes]MBD5782423.1 energy transducer TonB [Pelagicoccus enzymogenes]MDQ8199346.1 energy transducer TonB [Pelagicoccus enzymogenes]